MTCKHPDHKRARRHLKLRPYGQERGVFWCDGCDAELVSSAPSKKTERAEGKRQIRRAFEALLIIFVLLLLPSCYSRYTFDCQMYQVNEWMVERQRQYEWIFSGQAFKDSEEALPRTHVPFW